MKPMQDAALPDKEVGTHKVRKRRRYIEAWKPEGTGALAALTVEVGRSGERRSRAMRG